ncbi:hypothetical protein [Sedimenticola hydrogenitrophicus]|uniref:hypothetical protein n=1 Tax=Sedimenticola hydrogenitrophicus TaxID=2967975 RepID=UPI0021A8FE11|nr:hypothetical protein [Sedimenticola hydrogenitrophicus]
MSKESMLKLVQAAILAPSADNMQPWKFRVTDDSLELTLDRNLMGHFFDPADVATKIGCGALVENIDQYAQYLGLAMAVDRSSSGQQDVVARMTFTPVVRNDPGNFSSELFLRCTNRELYDRRQKIGRQARADLDVSVNSSDGFSLTFYDLPVQRKMLINTLYKADTIRFSHEVVHKDFYDVLRFGDSAGKTMDGLAQATLGIEFFFIPILRYLRSWRLTNILNKVVGLHHLMALRGIWLPMVSSAGLVSIVHSGSADYLEFGRVMERFWLQATRSGLSVQPLGAFPLFLARLNLLDGEGFSSEQVSRLRQLEQAFEDITPAYQVAERQLVMLFRLGYSGRAPGRSMRRPVDSFIE